MLPKYIAIDSLISRKSDDLHLIRKILENGSLESKPLLLLQFEKANNKVQNLLNSYNDFHTEKLVNKAGSSDIKTIFNYFAPFEKIDLNSISIQKKIAFGKKILYLDALSQNFIRRFSSNGECPGFWILSIGSFCSHQCTYCFLNLTMRIRPICVEHLNISKLESNLKYFNRKNGPDHLLNAGETSDPLDNEPILGIWNNIVNIVRESGNRILCLTKSNNVYNIPEPSSENKLDEIAIYSWSINPEDVVQKYELNTASTSKRLKAAKYVKDLGYPIRFRIDPILPLRLMARLFNGGHANKSDIDLENYYKLIDMIKELEPELVTLGTFRALPPLFNFVLDSKISKKHLIKDGKRFRVPKHLRFEIYKRIGNYLQDNSKLRISICKDPTIDLSYSTFKTPCQCLKLNVP